MVALPTAPFGVPTPIMMSGAAIGPHWAGITNASKTTTAGRLYYYPIYFDRIQTFAGAKTRNTGAGDNGETYRVGLYTESASGGPGSLVKDFGEVTLTGAAAVRTLASAVSTTLLGWHYIAVHHNTAAAMNSYGAGENITGAGLVTPNIYAGLIPTMDPASQLNSVGPVLFSFLFVDTAYGALAATAVAPTGAEASATAVMLYK